MNIASENGIEEIKFESSNLGAKQQRSEFLKIAAKHLKENNIPSKLPADPSASYYKAKKENEIARIPRDTGKNRWGWMKPEADEGGLQLGNWDEEKHLGYYIRSAGISCTDEEAEQLFNQHPVTQEKIILQLNF